MNNNLSTKTLEFLKDTCIFFQPWWLQAIAPNNWGIIEVKRGDEIAGVWPYTKKEKIGKITIQELPLIFSYSGPWLKKSEAKYAKTLAFEKDLTLELIDKLPKFSSFQQWLHPQISNWLPLYWKGFKQTTRYTYVIDKGLSLEHVWNGMLTNIRGDIRKAEKSVKINDTDDIIHLYELLIKTYEKQKIKLPISKDLLLRINIACKKNNAMKNIIAVDKENNIIAAAYLVFDRDTVYCILRASDPELRNNGANSLVVWKAIEYAISEGKNFDFAGSWNESIERFIRAFGAKQKPFFEIKKMDSSLLKYYRMIRKII